MKTLKKIIFNSIAAILSKSAQKAAEESMMLGCAWFFIYEKPAPKCLIVKEDK